MADRPLQGQITTNNARAYINAMRIQHNNMGTKTIVSNLREGTRLFFITFGASGDFFYIFIYPRLYIILRYSHFPRLLANTGHCESTTHKRYVFFPRLTYYQYVHEEVIGSQHIITMIRANYLAVCILFIAASPMLQSPVRRACT